MHFPHPDIKIGETYNLRIHVIGKSDDFIIARPITQNGGYATCSFLEILHKYAPSFTPIPSEHGTSVPTTKHDPCRKVKRGDRVKPRLAYGRTPIFGIDGVAVDVSSGDFIVETDEGERPNGTVDVKTSDGTTMTVDPVYLELVTPVEELEPYYVVEYEENIQIRRNPNGIEVARYDRERHPHAKAAAEAECKRLNDEYRKEQNNG